MSFLKKYWYLVLVTFITAGIGVIAYLTSIKLENKTTVAPTVPQETPQAVAPACKLVFSIAVKSPTPSPVLSSTPSNTPSNTPTPPPQCNSTCTGDAGCPSTLTCSNGFCRNPSCITESDCTCAVPTATRTVTPTPPLSCNSVCTGDSQCPSTMTCSNGFCRNPSCVESSNCTCAAPTATPVPPSIPSVPISGIGPTNMGLLALVGGFFFILIGLAF